MAEKSSSKKTAKKTSKKSAKKTSRKSAKKKTAKKAAAKKAAVKKAPKQEEQNWLPVVILLIGAALLLYGLISLFSSPDVAPPSETAAIVNDVEISRVQLDTQYAMLPPQYKAQLTKEVVLQQLIDEEILLQHGEYEEVSDEAVNEEIQSILASGQLTLADLQENLEQFNLTTDDFEDLIRRKLMLEQAMSSIFSDLEVPDEEVRAYYDKNLDQFRTDDQVTVRHVLIASQRDDAAVLSKGILERVQEGEDFCDIVSSESDDKGSVDNCGEYTFPRGYMVPEFEAASFDMAPGDVTMIQSVFGYHIIEKLADVPTSTSSFEDVEAGIRGQLRQELQVAEYQKFLSAAREKTNIQVFN